MILKYKDQSGYWNWVNGISEFSYLGTRNEEELDEFEATLLDKYNSDNPHVMTYEKDDMPFVLAVDMKEAFLVNPDTGSTIDVVYKER